MNNKEENNIKIPVIPRYNEKGEIEINQSIIQFKDPDFPPYTPFLWIQYGKRYDGKVIKEVPKAIDFIMPTGIIFKK